MNNISGISFYDSLNKLTVGILLLLIVVTNPCEAFLKPLFYIVAFFVGCVYQVFIRRLTPFMIQNKCMIEKASKKFFKENSPTNDIKDKYLEAYYNVAKNGILMNIPIMEAFENFFKNLFLILVLYLILILMDCTNIILLMNFIAPPCTLSAYLLFAIIANLCMWYHIQMKIYETVWEGSYYLKKLENNEKIIN